MKSRQPLGRNRVGRRNDRNGYCTGIHLNLSRHNVTVMVHTSPDSHGGKGWRWHSGGRGRQSSRARVQCCAAGDAQGGEGGGCVAGGLRYGEAKLVMKEGTHKEVVWQGPGAGWAFGGDAVKVFTLVYNLPDGETIYRRYPGVEGSAYLVGGIGINYQQRDDVVLAPMRSGVGLRLGASVGYLKYTKSREWLPF